MGQILQRYLLTKRPRSAGPFVLPGNGMLTGRLQIGICLRKVATAQETPVSGQGARVRSSEHQMLSTIN